MWFEVRVIKGSSLPASADCSISQVRIDMSKAKDIRLTDDGWRRFEETLSKLGRDTPLLEVVGENESTLESVLDHTILAKAATDGKLLLRAAYPADGKPEAPASTKEEVLGTSEEHEVDGDILKLTAAERLRFLAIQDSDKQAYLRSLKESRDSKGRDIQTEG